MDFPSATYSVVFFWNTHSSLNGNLAKLGNVHVFLKKFKKVKKYCGHHFTTQYIQTLNHHVVHLKLTFLMYRLYLNKKIQAIEIEITSPPIGARLDSFFSIWFCKNFL